VRNTATAFVICSHRFKCGICARFRQVDVFQCIIRRQRCIRPRGCDASQIKRFLLVAEETWFTNERKSPGRAINNMSHLGFLSFPGTGHLNPLAALGRRLQRRGYQVTVFQIADFESTIRVAGLDFIQTGRKKFPPGTCANSTKSSAGLADSQPSVTRRNEYSPALSWPWTTRQAR